MKCAEFRGMCEVYGLKRCKFSVDFDESLLRAVGEVVVPGGKEKVLSRCELDHIPVERRGCIVEV